MRRALALLVIAATTAVAAAATSAPAGAADCSRLSLTGETSLNPATGKVEGTFAGTLDGRATSIFSETSIVGQQQRGSVLVLSTQHTFTLPDGSKLGTVDRAILRPTSTPGVYDALSRLEIVSGASGRILGHGTIDLRSGVDATWHRVQGRVCAA